VGWFAMRGVTVERVLSDNGGCDQSHGWRDVCTELQIRHERTRPQANGKIERFQPWPRSGPSPGPTHRPAGQPAWADLTLQGISEGLRGPGCFVASVRVMPVPVRHQEVVDDAYTVRVLDRAQPAESTENEGSN
jgi:hypothetical protein